MDHVRLALPDVGGAPATAYLSATKPWLVLANLLTAAGGYLLAARGQVAPGHFLAAMAGIALVVASGCLCNNCLDRDVDRRMARTRGRALAAGALSLRAGLLFAGVLGLSGTTLLWAGTNALAVVVVLAGFAVYVGLYSAYLKRRSPVSTLWGSLAGAAAPLGGYCAVTGRFDLGALLVLALYSAWQIPHSYAITIYRRDDYAAAGLPVMAVARGVPAAKRLLVRHLVVFACLAPWLSLCGYAGSAYLAVSTILSLAWLGLAAPGYQTAETGPWARRLYLFSLVVVVSLSIALAVDCTRS